MAPALGGKVALVAGASRGAGRGVAVALGEAGATVYCTGARTRERRSEYDRPETIEETAELVTAAGGIGIAVAVDHLEPAEVEALVERIDAESGRLDVLVNDIWGAELLFEWNTPLWEHDLDEGAADPPPGDRHAPDHQPLRPAAADPRPGGLVVEMTDGTREYNAEHYRVSAFYDLAKTAVIRLAFAQSEELAPHGCAAVALTPGWMRSEMMLENYGVTEANWRDGAAINPHFAAISESPRFVGRAVAALAADPDVAPQRRLVLLRRAGAGVRLHRRRRLAARLLALPRRGAGRRPAGGPDGVPVIRRCRDEERDTILAIVNAAAQAYRGVIPPDRWREPYMAPAELDAEIAGGVAFWGYEAGGALAGVMGIQPVRDVVLIRHAYVAPAHQGQGVGAALLAHLSDLASRRMLVGTWAAAGWAVRFYRRHGFEPVPERRAAELLRAYWAIPERQVDTSVVLAKPPLPSA